MAPKRQRPSTPPRTAKKKRQGQSSIDSFFTSPSKPKVNNGRHRDQSVISIQDSDEEDSGGAVSSKGNNGRENGEEDEAMARRLAKEWAEQDGKEPPSVDKGKGRAVDTAEESVDDEIEIVDERPAHSSGVNGSSSSNHRSASTKRRSISPEHKPTAIPTKDEPRVKKEKNLAPMFSKSKPELPPRTATKEEDVDDKPLLPITTPTKGGTITSTTAEPVDAIDFDTDAFLFRPDDIDTSRWPKGRLPYSILVGVYVQVSSTRSRLMIVRVLTNFLHLLLRRSPIDLPPSLYLLSNHLLPNYIPCELGIGSQILSKAVQEVSGLQPKDLRLLWHKWGDPGDVAFEAKSNLRTLVKPSPLLVGDVYNRLLGLSKVKGQQSGKIKGDVVRKLMVQARGEEVRFLVRSMIGNLRIGAVRLTLLTSLARAAALFNMPTSLLHAVRPIPPPPPKAGPGEKRIPKPKLEPDPAREDVEERCLDAVKIVRKVYVRHPNYGDLVRGIAAGGLDGLGNRVPVSVGIPLSPMLGSITRSLNEVFTRLGSLPFTAEAKLDGQRVQIHARLHGPQGEDDGGGRWVESDDGVKIWVRLFSRHLEDMTEKYPDICHLILTLLSRPVASHDSVPSSASDASQTVLDLLQTERIDSFIMDAEVVAVDKDTGAYRTFQDLSNRAKKDVKVEDIKVVVGIFAFDLMLVNDKPLLEFPFSHRRHLLRTLFPPFSDPSQPHLARFAHVESLDSSDCVDVPSEMQAFFETVVEQKCEGLMVKLLESGEGITGEDDDDDGDGEDGTGGAVGGKRKKGTGGKKKPLPATYEPDQRSQGWLKVKKDYLEGLGDSLDLVPIGAWWGQGRKAGWWSPILLACHNPETGALEAVCKCISGFTDQFYKDLIKRYPPHNEIPEKCNTDTPLAYVNTGGLRPNVWFSPDEVWELRGADITLSPVYPAAATCLGSERGLSIRFPRFMKLREDKTWEQATSSEQFAEMYRNQIKVAPARSTNATAAIRRQSEEPEGEGEEGKGVPYDGEEGEEDGYEQELGDEFEDEDAG